MRLTYVLHCADGRRYYGTTRFTLRAAWLQHQLSAELGARSPLYDAIREYGSEAFRPEPVARLKDESARALARLLTITEGSNRPLGFNRPQLGGHQSEKETADG